MRAMNLDKAVANAYAKKTKKPRLFAIELSEPEIELILQWYRESDPDYMGRDEPDIALRVRLEALTESRSK